MSFIASEVNHRVVPARELEDRRLKQNCEEMSEWVPEAWTEFVPTVIHELLHRYYKKHLYLHQDQLPKEMLDLVLDYAADGFIVGDQVDAQSRSFAPTWCVAQVVSIDIEKGSILVHYLGWSSKFDTWVSSSEHVKPLFTLTKHRTEANGLSGMPVYRLTEFGFSEDEAREAIDRCKDVSWDRQNCVNSAYYLADCRRRGVTPECWDPSGTLKIP